MRSLKSLLTLFHNDLFDDLSDTELSHVTLNLVSNSISGLYRAGFENSFSLVTFTISPERCIGTLLVEADGHYWLEPRLFSWSTLEEYLDLFQQHPASDPLSWKTLLRRSASVEVVRFDQSSDVIEIHNTSGQGLTKSKKMMKHIESFT